MSDFDCIDNYFYDPEAKIPERLFHSTSLKNAKKILCSGANLTCSRDDVDFGPGLYTTRDLRQGFEWATRKNGACLTFVVDDGVWEQLDCVKVAGTNWENLVRECLCKLPWAQLSGDVIEGQICKNPALVRSRHEVPEGFGTQTVFRTARSFSCIELVANETRYPSSRGLNQ
jgi:hypothetical protein